MPKKFQPAGVAMTPCTTELGKFIRARRMQLDLRQVQVSTRTGMPLSYCSYLETGARKRLREDLIPKLAEVLECDPSELLALMPKKHHANPKTEFGWFIKTRVEQLGITNTELARRLHITSYAVRQLLYGRQRGTTYQKLRVFAQALEVEVSSLGRFVGSRGAKVTHSVLGQLVRDRRKELGLSIGGLATKLGVSKQFVCQIELGRVGLSSSDSVLEGLAKSLELDMAVLHAVRPQRRIKQVPTDQTTLGGFLAAHRLELHLTQREVARRADISLGYISQVEKGRRISLPALEKITSALDCQVPVELVPQPAQGKTGQGFGRREKRS